MKTDISLDLAARLSERVIRAFESGEMLQAVSPVTADLLKYWFMEPYVSERLYNFHSGQRQAILNIIYLHEILKIDSVTDIYQKVAPDLLAQADLHLLAADKYDLPKYAVKMATGTGKTWVMHALLLWQLLNARHESDPLGRYTRNFLIVAPGLVVYDRLLDAYMGRLDPETGTRDFETNDLYRNSDLFLPSAYRDEVFSFLRNNVVSKEEGIGRKTTADGLVALTNWHLFLSQEEEAEECDEASPAAIVQSLLPLRPGVSAGNSLDTLDRKFLRGEEMDYLASLPGLLVINDEAHHIHENKVGGEIQEVEWQKGLDYIAHDKE